MIAIPINLEPLPIRTVIAETMSLLRLRGYYESQINPDDFDPELSRKIDAINDLLNGVDETDN